MRDPSPEPTTSTPDDGPLVVSGEVDLATVPELRRRLGGAKTRAPELTVDLSAVTFIDCAGLRPLLEARRRQRADGGRLVLMSPSWAVVRLLQFTGLLAAFTVVDALSRAPGPLPTRRRGEPAAGRLSTRPSEPTASGDDVEGLRAARPPGTMRPDPRSTGPVPRDRPW
jgi:anti-sigma B factor antagonist